MPRRREVDMKHPFSSPPSGVDARVEDINSRVAEEGYAIPPSATPQRWTQDPTRLQQTVGVIGVYAGDSSIPQLNRSEVQAIAPAIAVTGMYSAHRYFLVSSEAFPSDFH